MTGAAGERILAYQHGIQPRSEAVVAATRGLERGRVTPDEVDTAFERDLEAVVGTQREAGLDLVSDGMLRWQDLYRPLVDATAGLEARGLVRWFDNNAFFRAPVVVGPLELDPDAVARVLQPVPSPRLVCLPSPYLFSRVVDAPGDRAALMGEIARHVLRPAITRLVADGVGLVHLQEPWLAAFGIDEDDWSSFEAALLELREAAPAGRVTLVLHTFFGDVTQHLDRLRSLPVDVVGVDLVETDIGALGTWRGDVLLGCLDGRSSIRERADDVARLARPIVERVAPATVYMSSTCDLELLPADVAAGKIRTLGDVARRLREDA